MRPTETQHREALALHADRLVRHLGGRLTADSWRPVRLSYGLYYQLDHTSHMQRIKLPGGLMTAEQLEVLADVSDRYGRGIGHFTTRQDLQIHWVPVEQIMDMYDQLLRVGITTRGACADSVRNVTGCPYAGGSPDEPFDVTPYILAVHEYFLFNPLNLTLPRKFKIAVEGCPLDCAQVPVNDIGVYAKLRDGQRGFMLYAGGGLGSQPFLSQLVSAFIPDEDLLVWCEAIVRVQHRHGERKNRNRARMKYVVKKMGLERFRQVVTDEVTRVAAERGQELRAEVQEAIALYAEPAAVASPPSGGTAPPGFEHWTMTNTRPQRQTGYRAVVVQLPLGDVTTGQMRVLARLAREFGNGTLRATDDQNVVLPSIVERSLVALYGILVDSELGNPDVSTINDVVSCPGMDYCSLAITRSMGMAERIRAHLLTDGEGFAARLGPFGVKISGCPNSCGQHHVGDIGLTGHTVTEEDGVQRPYYSILVGGSVGEARGRIGKRVGRYREEAASAAVAAVARFYEREREGGERFPEFVDRMGLPRLVAVADAGAKASPA
ncbi:MAG: nitrite/sulfite reductase [Candidatus Binatia bacterium]